MVDSFANMNRTTGILFRKLNTLIVISLLGLSMTAMGQRKKELVFATYTYSTNTRIENLKPLASWLENELGIPVKPVSYPSVKALINAIEHDSADIAMINTVGYLLLRRNGLDNMTPAVQLASDQNVTDYGGCIIINTSDSTRSLKELMTTDHQLALVAPSSASGNMLPRLLLSEAGYPFPEKNTSVYYAGTHLQVLQDVASGKATVGGCGCFTVQQEAVHHKNIATILAYNNIPLGPVLISKRLNRKTTERIYQKLLNVHENAPEAFRQFREGWTEFKTATNFRKVPADDYDRILNMLKNNGSLWSLLEGQ